MKEIIELVDLLLRGNTKFWYVIFLFVTLWLFKEIRSRYIKEYDFEISRLDKVIEVYGLIEMNIITYLKYYDEEASKSLFEKMSASYPYISDNLYSKWANFIEEPSRHKLEKYLYDLRKETAYLKREQETRIPMVKKNIFMYCISHIKTFFMPAYITLIVLLILLMLVVSFFITTDEKLNIYEKLNIFSIGFGILIFLILVYFVGQLILDKKFKHTLPNWTLLLGLLASLIVLIVLKLTFIFLILYFLYMIYFASKLVIRTE